MSESGDTTPERPEQRSLSATEFQAELDRAASADLQVSNVNLRGVDLRSIKWPDQSTITLKNCDFTNANLSHDHTSPGSSLPGTIFDECTFQQTDLTGANLIGTRFESACNLHGAILRDAVATGAEFLNADMKDVDATNAVFLRSRFTGSQLQDATLDLADLRYAEGLRLDQTRTRGAKFSKRSENPWSKLRRVYTGPRLILNLLPVMIFVATLAVKAYALYLLAILEGGLGAEAIAAYCKRPATFCQNSTVLGVLSGYRAGWLEFLFVTFAASYNLMRFGATVVVSGLREAEDQSGVSPPYKTTHRSNLISWYSDNSYWLPEQVHNLLQYLQVGMYLLFVSNLYKILFASVIFIR
jgi:uncharacterized protein YjbI with pentapeptide repeats